MHLLLPSCLDVVGKQEDTFRSSITTPSETAVGPLYQLLAHLLQVTYSPLSGSKGGRVHLEDSSPIPLTCFDGGSHRPRCRLRHRHTLGARFQGHQGLLLLLRRFQ
jgi:hypothetical protein